MLIIHHCFSQLKGERKREREREREDGISKARKKDEGDENSN